MYSSRLNKCKEEEEVDKKEIYVCEKEDDLIIFSIFY